MPQQPSDELEQPKTDSALKGLRSNVLVTALAGGFGLSLGVCLFLPNDSDKGEPDLVTEPCRDLKPRTAPRNRQSAAIILPSDNPELSGHAGGGDARSCTPILTPWYGRPGPSNQYRFDI